MTLPPSRLTHDIIQWDIRTWSRALRYWEAHVNWHDVQHCLELGGRQGGLSLWLALKNKQVLCSDLSDTELHAKPLHTRHGIQHLITYRDIDATEIPYRDHFDLVVFKSIVGGIGRNNDKLKQQRVFEQIHASLRPGGYLLFAENLSASPLHRYLRKRFNRWGSYWRYPTLTEMHEFLKPFQRADVQTTGFAAAFGQSETQRNMLAKADEVLSTMLPASWNYVAYGIAIK